MLRLRGAVLACMPLRKRREQLAGGKPEQFEEPKQRVREEWIH